MQNNFLQFNFNYFAYNNLFFCYITSLNPQCDRFNGVWLPHIKQVNNKKSVFTDFTSMWFRFGISLIDNLMISQRKEEFFMSNIMWQGKELIFSFNRRNKAQSFLPLVTSDLKWCGNNQIPKQPNSFTFQYN